MGQSVKDGWKTTREFLLHMGNTYLGYRQDIGSMSALIIYWNQDYYVAILDDIKTDSENNDNIGFNYLYKMLNSIKMESVVRLWAILYLVIIMPIRYMANNIHMWASLNWDECAQHTNVFHNPIISLHCFYFQLLSRVSLASQSYRRIKRWVGVHHGSNQGNLPTSLSVGVCKLL